jgi:hypothetical protein
MSSRGLYGMDINVWAVVVAAVTSLVASIVW